jgi:Ca2+-binding RTX toxin-like protein
LFGTEQTERINTQHRDLFIGSSYVDSFVLSATGVATVDEADVIVNFDVEGDRLQLSDELATANLVLQVVDMNQDGVFDSTAIRLGEEGNILAIALNTVNDAGSTHLSSLVISNATISTSPTPLTWSRELDTTSRPTPISTIDYVLGTSQNDVISSTAAYDVLIGFGGADTFVLSSAGVADVLQADVIVDFSWAEGDRIGLPNNIAFDALQLQVADLDRNGIVESTVIQVRTTGAILAVALNTVDLAGQTVLNSGSFVTLSS